MEVIDPIFCYSPTAFYSSTTKVFFKIQCTIKKKQTKVVFQHRVFVILVNLTFSVLSNHLFFPPICYSTLQYYCSSRSQKNPSKQDSKTGLLLITLLEPQPCALTCHLSIHSKKKQKKPHHLSKAHPNRINIAKLARPDIIFLLYISKISIAICYGPYKN